MRKCFNFLCYPLSAGRWVEHTFFIHHRVQIVYSYSAVSPVRIGDLGIKRLEHARDESRPSGAEIRNVPTFPERFHCVCMYFDSNHKANLFTLGTFPERNLLKLLH